MSGMPAGWYADPSKQGRQRYWDGSAWTRQVRSAPPTGAPPAPAQPWPPPPTGSPPPEGGGSEGRRPARGGAKGRGRLVLLTAGLGVLVAAGLTAAIVVLDPFGEEEASVADGSRELADDPVSGDDDRDSELRADPEPEAETDPGPSGVPLSQIDLDAAELRIDHGEGPVTVVLRGGQGELDDGRWVRRIRELTVRGDVTGDGVEEIVVVLAVERGGGDAEVPAVAVLTDDAELGATSLEPPRLTVPARDRAWDPVEDGFVGAISVRDGGIELGLVAQPPGESSLVFTDQRADPLVENRRPEIRLTYLGDSWSAEADGPITRAAADFAERAGVPAQELLCDGRPVPWRGANPSCVGSPVDGSGGDVEVSLLVVDDRGGFRGEAGRPPPVSSAAEVRRVLGPGEHFCRDIAERAAEDSLSWALPMAAVAYWFDDGMPQRMDASQNGIPCQTVFDGVAAFLNGVDGVIAPHDATLRS